MIQLRPLLAVLLVLSMSYTAQAQQRVRRNVEVEWEAIPDATAYEVQVVRKDDKKKKPLLFKSKEPSWAATIKPGIYNMQIRSYDDRGVPGDWSPASELVVKLPAVIGITPDNNSVVAAKNEKEHELEFKWEVVPGAAKYKFTAKSATSDWTYEKEITGTSIKVDVPAAQIIDWTVHALDPKNEVGDQWQAAQTVEVQGPALDAPSIAKPISEYVKEITWNSPKNAKNYSYNLEYYNTKSKKWEFVTKQDGLDETKLMLDTSRKTGKYRIQVQAHGERRQPSTVAQLDFKMRGGFRDPAAMQDAILRDSITKPTNFYAIGSYFITQVNYESAYFDQNARSSFDALGSTARIGMGYQNPKAKYGAFGIIDVSMFNIGGDQFTFSSVEAHMTRKSKMSHGGVLLLGGGFYLKELPIVKGTQSSGYVGAGKVSNMGPHIGFTYWLPFNERFGFQTNGRIYYSMMGSAPTGDVESALSYQLGILGSYRLTSAWMSYAGYAYRADEALFKTAPGSTSFAQPGQTNKVNFDGHFLNLMFEYSF